MKASIVPVARSVLLWTVLAVFISGDVLRADAPSTPFDIIRSAYLPYMEPADPLAFPLKVKSLAADPYTFWRGSKDLFFRWAKDHCSDWADDEQAYVAAHGDLHLGNIGSYAADGPFGTLAFGMVDFDDATRLPFQIELLQGEITLRLIAREKHLDLSASDERQLGDAMHDAYRSALLSDGNAGDLLVDERGITKLIQAGREHAYREELDQYVADGKFKRAIRNGRGELKELLRPAESLRDAIAIALADAAARSPRLKSRLRYSTAEELKRTIRDVAFRTRIGSSGSQGLKKILVLMDKPLVDVDHDIILYLKQQISTAAERQGFVIPVSQTPGERCAALMRQMTSPPPFLCEACELGAESYWLSVKEPWSDELDAGDVKDLDDLRRAARIWGTIAGVAHRAGSNHPELIVEKLTPALRKNLETRAQTYLALLTSDFETFRRDERVDAIVRDADAALIQP